MMDIGVNTDDDDDVKIGLDLEHLYLMTTYYY
jgi:hypothetical protein